MATSLSTQGAGSTLAQRLQSGPPVLMDGGTGTELERRGAVMDPNVWGARAAINEPGLLKAVHRSFLDAGAELIIANTYPANLHVMTAAGLADEFEAANRGALEAAVAATREAREQRGNGEARSVWIAGSMSTTTFSGGLDQDLIESAGSGVEGYRAQAEIIAESGVDLIILEMMRDVEQTLLCMEAAAETGLPVWLGLSVERGPDASLVFHGSDLCFDALLPQILRGSTGLQAVGIMHSQLYDTPEALATLGNHWRGPGFAYPHHGVFDMPHWRFDNTLSAAEFAESACRGLPSWVRAVGGCCGIRPEHIAALGTRLRATP